MVFNNNLLLGAAGQGGGAAPFDPTLIGNSVWIDGSADYLNRTPSSAGTTTRWIVSCWVQRNKIYPVQTVAQNIFSAGTALGNLTWIRFDDLDHLDFAVYQGSPTARKTSSAKYRDVGWYHICVSFDSGSGIAAGDRIRLFVNGVEVTDLSDNTDTPSGETTAFNDNVTHQIGRYSYNGSEYIPAYLAQFTMLENKSFQNGDLSISDLLDSFTFGTNGSQYVPKADADIAALATTAGGNSFCLDFADSGDLGNDISSNANDFTPNSMSSANQTTNTPSLVYPVWNTLEAAATLSNGNLNARSTSSQLAAQATQSVSSGKFYWEITANTNNNQLFGITGEAVSYANRIAVAFNYTPTVFFYGFNGNIYQDGSSTAYDSAISAGDVIGIAVDFDAGKIWFAKNNTWLQSGDPANGTSPSATFTVGTFTPSWCAGGASGDRTGAADFGQLGFTYTPPTGFVSLNSENLTAPDYQGIDYFDATLYEGNGTGQRVGDFVPFTDAYTVANSAMFQHDEVRALSRTVGTPSSTGGKKGTWSTWYKTANIDTDNIFFDTGTTATNRFSLQMDASGQISFVYGATSILQTNADLKGGDLWRNLVLKVDTSLATAADRAIMYIDGVEVTSFAVAFNCL